MTPNKFEKVEFCRGSRATLIPKTPEAANGEKIGHICMTLKLKNIRELQSFR